MKDAFNPIEYYSDEEFGKRYQFSKNIVIEYILLKVIVGFEK